LVSRKRKSLLLVARVVSVRAFRPAALSMSFSDLSSR
jgi:hypothetical protein